MTRAATLGRTAFGIAVAAALAVGAIAGAGEPPAAAGGPPPAPAPAAGLDPMDPAALRMALLAQMDAKVDAAAGRGHLEARLTLDAVMPLPYLGIDAEAEGAGMKVTKVYANYLVARTNAAENDLRIFRTVNGIRRTLPDGRAKVSTDDDRWHVLEVRAEGPKITATLDGTTSVTSYDTYLGRGRAGVWTKSDSRTDFDDLVVTPTRR